MDGVERALELLGIGFCGDDELEGISRGTDTSYDDE